MPTSSGWRRWSASSPSAPSKHTRTAIIIAAGLVIAALFVFAGRLFGRGPESMALGAKIFIPLWFIAAAINLWVGVAKAGYSFMEELPIFLVIFALPAAAAGYIWWRYS